MTPPSTIAHYRLLCKIGEGGMGAVYCATDTKLNREVAIKVLPPAFAEDAERMGRFEREARVLASLNHPNIAAIYGIEHGAIVMELVEGEDLQGPVPFETAIDYARQIAGGLEAAHEKGIIHRDLKPANIKVTPAGTIKLLDFGLAKFTEQNSADGGSPSMSSTVSLGTTGAGMILGTPSYMAPEQARGEVVDRRADIWAFGAVLFEMFTGKRIFVTNGTVADIISAVLTRELEWNLLPAGTPPHVRRLMELCLRKEPKQRLRDIGDARIALGEPFDALTPEPPPLAAARRGWLVWAMTVLAAAAILAAGLGWWRATRLPESRPMVRLNVEISPDLALLTGISGGMLALSPDGTRIAVPLRGADGTQRLYTRLLNQNQISPLADTDGANTPFFSPDSRWIGFAADGKIRKIPVEGGAAETICEAPIVRGASWGDDGNIVLSLSNSGGLSRVSSAGGTPAPLTKLNPGERTHRWPQVLAGSETVLFTAHSGSSNYNEANIEAISLKTGTRKTVQRGGFSGRYVITPDRSGELIYQHQTTLFAAPFDLGRLERAGAPVAVLDDVSRTGIGGGNFAFSSTGTFVYLTENSQQGKWTIAWVDRAGKKQPLHTPPGLYYTPRISPDGKRLAFAIESGQGYDLWVQDLDGGTPSRLSFLKGTNNWPVWTPDGKHIIFKSTDFGRPGLYSTRSDGAGEAVRLTDGTLDEFPYSISPDGKRLSFTVTSNGNNQDVFTALFEGDSERSKLGKPELFLGTPFVETRPTFSPDGRWMAYLSNESGSFEIYVRPFPGPGRLWQVSTGGGDFPMWSRDGHELVFRGPDLRVMVANYTTEGDSFVLEKASPWPETHALAIGILSTWDLSPDGKHLVVFSADAADEGQKPPTHLTFLLNFFDAIERRK